MLKLKPPKFYKVVFLNKCIKNDEVHGQEKKNKAVESSFDYHKTKHIKRS